MLALAAAQIALAWLLAAVVVLPFTAPLARHPDGGRALYAEGGRILLDLARERASTVGASLWAVGLVAVLYAAQWFFLGALLPALGVTDKPPPLYKAAAYSLRRAPTLVALALMALGGYALAGATAWFAWTHADRHASTMPDARAADLLLLRSLLPALLVAGLVTVWHDVARVCAVGDGSGATRTFAAAWSRMLREPVRTLGGAVWFALLGALGALVAYGAARLWGAQGATGAVVALALVEQSTLVWRFLCRAMWFFHLSAPWRARATHDSSVETTA